MTVPRDGQGARFEGRRPPGLMVRLRESLRTRVPWIVIGCAILAGCMAWVFPQTAAPLGVGAAVLALGRPFMLSRGAGNPTLGQGQVVSDRRGPTPGTHDISA